MTAREKAVRLVDRYLDEVFNEVSVDYPLELPKRLAIIAVNEILNEYWSHDTSRRDWWKEVKQEIEKL